MKPLTTNYEIAANYISDYKNLTRMIYGFKPIHPVLNQIPFEPQAIGHGIPSSLLDKIREAAKQFFALPLEEKHKYSRAANEGEGYGHDVIVSEKQILDWSSRLSLMVYPEDQRRLNLWPQNPTDFKYMFNT